MKIEIGDACSTYRGEKRCIQGFDGENLKGRDHLEDKGVRGTSVLKWVVKELDGGEWLRMGWSVDWWVGWLISLVGSYLVS
jgi:hypothetical protein